MDRDVFAAIFAEFGRIGLRTEDLPGLALSAGAEAEFLAHLRRLPAGAAWRDACPDLPAHWVPGRPETWTGRYRPFGPYDYQEPPAGPAVHVTWESGGDRARLEALVAEARAAGWPVYGAGPIDGVDRAGAAFDAFVILARGTSDDVLWEFVEWLEERGGPELAGVPRRGTEAYAP